MADLADEDLVRLAGASAGAERREALGTLYARHHRRVASWCSRICGDSQLAADLAQDVFVRVHERVDTFRGEARFTTWLYTVTRTVVLNRLRAEMVRETSSLDADRPEPEAGAASAEDALASRQILERFRAALDKDLEPLEARILVLHYARGMTLPAITEMLGLDNKSGAKAYIVSGRRKLERRFGRWLAHQLQPRSHP